MDLYFNTQGKLMLNNNIYIYIYKSANRSHDNISCASSPACRTAEKEKMRETSEVNAFSI